MDVQVVRPPDVTGEGLDPFDENEQILPEDIANNPNVSILIASGSISLLPTSYLEREIDEKENIFLLAILVS